MNSNLKIASALLELIIKAKVKNIKLEDLESGIADHLSATDSTFPSELKDQADSLVLKVFEQKGQNLGDVLNTGNEFSYNEEKGIGDIFDNVIHNLKSYIEKSS